MHLATEARGDVSMESEVSDYTAGPKRSQRGRCGRVAGYASQT